MKYFVVILLILSACQSKKADPQESPITGEWEYETIELYSGEKFDRSDSMFNLLHLQHVGLTISFTGNKTFTATRKHRNEPDEFLGKQHYKLEGDTILRLINTGRPDDRFPIISLNDSLLKANLFNSPLGYLVFRRKK
ncbi:MAG TPA: hypothetical protein VMZ03_02760 [Chitinophagaceae bacterium]|nr:hypothetical protein [Chitinophagaceae bacterium]